MRYRLMIRKLGVSVLCLLLWLLASAGQLAAQKPEPRSFFSFRDKQKPKVFLTLDRTSSFVGGKAASTNELKFGLEFRKKLRLGLGFGALVSDVVAPKSIVTESTQLDSTVNAELTFGFVSWNAEYIFYDSKRWQIAMPVSLGAGSSYFEYFEKTGPDSFKTKQTDQGPLMFLSATGVATYRVIRWVGLSAGVGYRFAIINNNKIDESFNSPVYTFKIRVFLGEIYKSIFPRGISGKRNPPYSNEYWD